MPLSKNITLEFVQSTHSVPQAVIAALHTHDGVIIYANDFKFDASNAVTTIGLNAFEGSDIGSITIPKEVTSIGASAFLDAESLDTLGFEAGSVLASIGASAFVGTGITSVNFTNTNTTLTNIYANAFSGLSLATINFGTPASTNGITVAAGAFTGATLTTLTLPVKVTLAPDSFKNSSVTTLEIGATTTAPPAAAFSRTDASGDPLPLILVNLDVTADCTGTFTPITSITTMIYTGATAISGNYSALTGLTKVTLPAGITAISGSFPSGSTTDLDFALYDGTGGGVGDYTFVNGNWVPPGGP
jgi:hypothetical protein